MRRSEEGCRKAVLKSWVFFKAAVLGGVLGPGEEQRSSDSDRDPLPSARKPVLSEGLLALGARGRLLLPDCLPACLPPPPPPKPPAPNFLPHSLPPQ